MKPLVSICIPNYNYEDFLEDAIRSALSQTYKNVEVLVVDNCSTDRSWSIIKSFGRKIKAHRNKRNLGHVDNMNRCIELSRGKYAVILGSDDMLDKESVEKQVRVMESNPKVGFVHGSTYVIDKDDKIVSESSLPRGDHIVSGAEKLMSLLEGNHVMMSSVMIRRVCFEELGMLDSELSFCPDWDMWLRICMKYDAAFIKDFIAYYRKHERTISTSQETEKIAALDQYKMLNKIFEIIPEEMAKEKDHFYYLLAREQLVKSLVMTINGNSSHARKHVIASILVYNSASLLIIFPFFYALTFLGKYPSKAVLKFCSSLSK